MDPPVKSNDFTLFTEEHSRRDGTGETRQTLSWIWLVKTQADGTEKGDDDILWMEWSNSQARAKCTQEEVLLLQEEMCRSLQYLAHWWESQAAARSVDKDLAEGLQAYSAK